MVFPQKTVNKIYSTKEILEDLETCITKKEPFSITRLGDAGHGILSVFLCPSIVDVGKWSGKRGERMANNILGQLTVPMSQRKKVVQRVANACNNANYTDCYEAFYDLDTKKGVGILGRNWKEIHLKSGIENENYCNPFVHYFSIVEDELNLFDLIEGRKIFCVTSRIPAVTSLQNKFKNQVDYYRIPRRGRKAKHYKDHFRKVCKLLKKNAKNYDLFLIGAGLLATIYCDIVKKNGGRAFDSGRLFDFWSGVRIIDSRPKRFLKYDPRKMLCTRKRKPRSDLW